MKHLLSLSIICIVFNLSAQSKWSLGLHGEVEYSTTIDRIVIDPFFGELTSSVSPIDYISKGIFIPGFGASIGYQLNNKLQFQGGIVINNQGGQTGAFIVWPSELNAMGRFVDDPTLTNDQIIRERHQFLALPLHLRLLRPNSISKWYFEFGISPNIYLNSTSKAIVNGMGLIEKSKSRLSIFRPISATMDIGLGKQFAIGDKTSVFIQPMIRHFFLSVLKKELYKVKYWSFGVDFGMTYTFSK